MNLSGFVFQARELSPVMITVPHDGLRDIDFEGLLKTRTTGYKGRDLHVWPIVRDVLVAYRACAIRAMIPRDFVDFNRSWPLPKNYYPLTQKEVHTALEDPRLPQTYQEYHRVIDILIGKKIQKFGKERCLLLDMHGFIKQPPHAPSGGYDIIIGTGNRASVPHGDVDKKFAKFFQSRGYKIFLPEDKALGPEEDWYSADFTTRDHSERHGINCLQLEIARRFRTRTSQELGKRLSADLAEFISNL